MDAIASARAYQVTGNAAYVRMAAANFNAVWARSWSADFGGGLWWRTARARLARREEHDDQRAGRYRRLPAVRDLHDRRYLDKAEALYAWERATLFNPNTGQVNDSISYTKTAARGPATYQFTYNQGTFIGAATMLYKITGQRQYYADALKALSYTRAHMTQDGILTSDGTGPGRTTVVSRASSRAGPCASHATTASRATTPGSAATRRPHGSHRDARGLMGLDWTSQTQSGLQHSWDCSGAVAMMEALLPVAKHG